MARETQMSVPIGSQIDVSAGQLDHVSIQLSRKIYGQGAAIFIWVTLLTASRVPYPQLLSQTNVIQAHYSLDS